VDKNWVIAGKPDDAVPTVGREYEIRDRRKGTFSGRILAVNGEWAEVEVTKGKPYFMSLDYKLGYNGFVSIRAGLVYLIEQPAAEGSEAWILKCNDCGATFDENEKLPMKANPSGIMQSHCSKCYGALTLQLAAAAALEGSDA
jgi:hypothetical protein